MVCFTYAKRNFGFSVFARLIKVSLINHLSKVLIRGKYPLIIQGQCSGRTQMISKLLQQYLQNRVPAGGDESRLPSFSRVSRLSLSLSWVERENVCQSITIKWRIFDSNERFFMIFVKNISFSKNKFIVNCVLFRKNTSLINDNFLIIFVRCFIDDICFFLDINVYFANVVVDFFDVFNAVYNHDVDDIISRNFMFFMMFRINAFDVNVIIERIHLISINVAVVTCFLIHVIFFTSRKYDDRIMFNSSKIVHFVFYLSQFIVHIILSSFLKSRHSSTLSFEKAFRWWSHACSFLFVFSLRLRSFDIRSSCRSHVYFLICADISKNSAQSISNDFINRRKFIVSKSFRLIRCHLVSIDTRTTSLWSRSWNSHV